MTSIHSPVSEIPFAKKFNKKLKRLDIETVKDLLWHFPHRYEDFSNIKQIKNLEPNEHVTIKGTITDTNIRRSWKKKFIIFEATISDKSESVKVVWFNQPYLKKTLKEGKKIFISGKPKIYKKQLTFSNPIYELADKEEETTHTAGIIPIYHETKGLTSRGLRYLIEKALKEFEGIPDIIPKEIRKKSNIPDINQALHQIHFPQNQKEIDQARKRFSLEDAYLLQLSNFIQRSKRSKDKANKIKIDQEKIKLYKQSLPYQLTNDQEEALKEITNDLNKKQPMKRLLQGDVGSGKTIVAFFSAIITADNNFQTAIMAPTEILAQQHYQTFKEFFSNFDKGVALLTNKESKMFFGEGLENETSKKDLRGKIKENSVKIAIGTHSLIQKKIYFKKLALAIIDEQHRFGVKQRAKLTKNKEIKPHLLSMTATPIPRTLAITIFGNLDISSIKELPGNRKPVTTKIVSPKKRKKAYQFIKQEIKEGRQAFVICPKIESSENNKETTDKRAKSWENVKAVKEEHKKLSEKVFPNLNIETLHGKLKSSEKQQRMEDFSKGKIDMLISTSVVEVGIDVPNATIMMIEGAERFGLAQLYQFQGRVGRGEHKSYCLLFSNSCSPKTRKRLRSIVQAKDGFELAQKDLEIRGPGEFIGKNQAGMPDTAMEALQDQSLVEESRKLAKATIKKDPELKNHPELKKRVSSLESKIHRE